MCKRRKGTYVVECPAKVLLGVGITCTAVLFMYRSVSASSVQVDDSFESFEAMKND